MNPRVIWALVLRYIFLYTRNPIRLVEMTSGRWWTCSCGETSPSSFSATPPRSSAAHPLPARRHDPLGHHVPRPAGRGHLLSGGRVDAEPAEHLRRPRAHTEYLAATFTVGILRICVTGVVLGVVAWLGYRFNIFTLEWWLVPFFLNLMVFGWSLGMISTALILRWGQAAESLAWGRALLHPARRRRLLPRGGHARVVPAPGLVLPRHLRLRGHEGGDEKRRHGHDTAPQSPCCSTPPTCWPPAPFSSTSCA